MLQLYMSGNPRPSMWSAKPSLAWEITTSLGNRDGRIIIRRSVSADVVGMTPRPHVLQRDCLTQDELGPNVII